MPKINIRTHGFIGKFHYFKNRFYNLKKIQTYETGFQRIIFFSKMINTINLLDC